MRTIDDESKRTFAYQAVSREEHVMVMQSGFPSDEAAVTAMLEEIDLALRTLNAKRVVFDQRDTDPAPAWVEAMIWSWLANHVRLVRAAFIEPDPGRRARVEARATRAWRGISMPWVGRVEIMAFADEPDAAAWVRPSPDPIVAPA